MEFSLCLEDPLRLGRLVMTTIWEIKHSIQTSVQKAAKEHVPSPLKKILRPAVRFMRRQIKRLVIGYGIVKRPGWSKPRAQPRYFSFRGKQIQYFYHRYNLTWTNERAVEIPIVWDVVQRYRGRRVLEVGNVLSHYFPVEHEVVDKYEKAPSVINLDVVDFHPSGQYDLIVSISTLEHVGWDEDPQDPSKALHAFENLLDLLAPGGEIVITLPVGENTEIVRFAVDGVIPFTELVSFKRVSRENDWEGVDPLIARKVKMNDPYRHANAVLIGSYKDKRAVPTVV